MPCAKGGKRAGDGKGGCVVQEEGLLCCDTGGVTKGVPGLEFAEGLVEGLEEEVEEHAEEGGKEAVQEVGG